MNVIAAIIRKDLIVEYRSRQTFIPTLFFGLLVLVVGNFSLSVAGEQQTIIAPGILWISFLFSGLLFLNHTLASEKEENSLAGLLISPTSPGKIFLGKMLSATIFLVALETILFPVFHILFNFPFTLNSLWLYLIIILAAVGYCSIGVLLATMALGVKNREILLSVLLFPILIPVLIMAVKASIILLNQLKIEQFFNWLKLLLAFDIIYVVLSYWSYQWILEDV
ncbi:MAG TPA: heme exporter protein CcmB [Acidobacteriota bacterium]|nr:heme exporter protein CcmB [Acidobacteriota bacterium]